MSEAFVQGVARGVDDVGRSIEIGFSNLEMDDVPAFCFQRARLHQNLKRGLGAEARHTLCKAEFADLSHDAEISIINALAQLVFLATSRSPGRPVMLSEAKHLWLLGSRALR